MTAGRTPRKRELLIALSAVGLLATTAVVVAALRLENGLRAEATAREEQRARELASHVTSSLGASAQVATTAASLASAVENRAGAEALLSRLFEARPKEVDGIGIWYEPYAVEPGRRLSGAYLHQGPGAQAPQLTDRWTTEASDYPALDWYRAGLQALDQPVFVKPSVESDHGYQTIAQAFLGPDRTVRGVVTVDFTLPHLDEMLQGFTHSSVETLYLVSPRGALIAHSEGDALAAWTQAQGTSLSLLSQTTLGESHLSRATVGRTGWTLVSAVPSALFERPIQILREIVLLSLGGLWILLAAGYFAVSRSGRARAMAQELEWSERLRHELRARERSLQSVIDVALDAVVVVDDRGRVEEWNARAEQIFGWPRAEAVGASLLELVIPERLRAMHEVGSKRFRDEQGGALAGRRVVITARHRHGTEFPLEVAFALDHREGRSVIYCFAHDVTERLRRREELEHSLSLLRSSLEATADGILVVDHDGRIATCNERFAELWRIPSHLLASVEQSADARLLGHIAEQMEDPAGFTQRVLEIYANPSTESFDELRFKDGRSVERFSRPRTQGGREVGRVWSFRDVTAARHGEEERRQLLSAQGALLVRLEHRTTKLQAVLDNMLEGVMVVDADGRGRLLNRAGAAMLGLAGAGLEQQVPLVDFVPLLAISRPDGTALGAQEQPLRRALLGHVVTEAEVRILPVGALRSLHVRGSAAPMRNAAGEIIGAVAIFRDVTATAEYEEMKAEFVRVAAHELKTPVTVMKAYAQLLLMRSAELPEGLAAMLRGIERGSDRIDSIVRDLVDVSQLHRGTLDLREAEIDLARLAAEVVAELPQTFACRHHIRISPEGDTGVRADPLRVRQVLRTMIDNAIRYSPTGGEILVSVEGGEEAIRVEVSDTGIGIPSGGQLRLFEPFFRAHSGTAFDHGGLGVGLYLSREIVRGHGGDVHFRSDERSGSTFGFRIPRRSAAAAGKTEDPR